MRHPLRYTLLAMTTSLSAAGCATNPVAPRPALVNHVVLIKLNNLADAAPLLADCDRVIPRIHGVVWYAAGGPLDTGRSMVDSDYDVALYIGYESVRAYDAYVIDPAHVAILNRWKPKCQWIRIHDMIDQTP